MNKIGGAVTFAKSAIMGLGAAFLVCALATASRGDVLLDTATAPSSTVALAAENSCGALVTIGANDVFVRRITSTFDPVSPGTAKFFVFSHPDHTSLLTTTAVSFADIGTFPYSTQTLEFNLFLAAGTTVDVGAILGVDATFLFDTTDTTGPYASSVSQNPNFLSYATPFVDSHGTDDCWVSISGAVCHDICTAGPEMDAQCADPCIATLCANDPYCCHTEWDTQCVAEVAQYCGRPDCLPGGVSQCGDGFVTTGEQCDDGNTIDDGNCCSAGCQFIAADTECPDTDGLSCTVAACNGFGTCSQEWEYLAAGTPCPDDDTNPCTVAACDGSATCVQGPTDTASCYDSPAAKLQINDSAVTGKDKLTWQWSKGDAFEQTGLGDPTNADSYMLCVFDSTSSSPSFVTMLEIAPSNSKWLSKDPKGLLYKDKEGTSHGVTKAQIKTGESGKTKVKVSASTLNLELPAPFDETSFFDQDTNVILQLINTSGACWTSSFAAADTKTNDADSFKAQVK